MKSYYSMPFPALKEKAKTVFNKWIRNRDRHDGCISGCGGYVEHAAHLYSANIFWWLMFDEVNTNGGCRACNYYEHPVRTDNYVNGIILKWGSDVYDELVERSQQERTHDKLDRDFYISIIEKYSDSKSGRKG